MKALSSTKPNRRSGTTLVEVLVVMVVFLVGILAIAQIFPGGFKVLSRTARNTMATQLARSEIERVKGRADQLPFTIIPVKYLFSGGQILIQADPDRFPNDLGPAYGNMDATGELYDAGNQAIGNWQYLTGANISRRVLGEGDRIPAPRLVNPSAGSPVYGSLLTLQFAPLVYNPNYVSIFLVYGNDMAERLGNPNGLPVRTYEFWLDQSDTSNAQLLLPPQPATSCRYRVNMTVVVNTGAGTARRDLVDVTVPPVGFIPPDPSGQPYVQNISALLPPGDTLISVEEDSVRVARRFEEIPVNQAFDGADPYQYKLLSPQLGLVLFNPVGYDYQVRTNHGRREPLVGRADYDVYDWRILREEFRVPTTQPSTFRLSVFPLMVKGNVGQDGRPNTGLGFDVSDGAGGTQALDLVLQDTETGGILLYRESTSDPTQTSFTINKSKGLITFLDYDSDPANGIQARIIYPGDTVATTITVDDRTMRALYMGQNEWALQVLKPCAEYRRTDTRPGIGQYLVGANGRVYFPPCDTGRVVTLGEVYYVLSGVPQGPASVTSVINPPDGSGLPYIDVPSELNYNSAMNTFDGFDESYGSAVKNVKGASVAVRVLWNGEFMHLTPDPATNMDELDKWMQNWRRTTVETYLQRGF